MLRARLIRDLATYTYWRCVPRGMHASARTRVYKSWEFGINNFILKHCILNKTNYIKILLYWYCSTTTRIHFLFGEFTMNLLWIFAKSLWIYYFSREFTMNSVSCPRIHYLLRLFIMNSLSILRNQNTFDFFFANALSILWLNYDLNFCCTNTLSFPL